MNHVGLAIHPDTNDLFLRADGSLAVVRDGEAVGQHARQRLKTFEGEWFLDTTAGVPWLDEIFARNFDPALAESVVKAELLETDGVTAISNVFSVTFDRRLRNLMIREIDVVTVYNGTVTI